jgi:hypothetical protein
MKTKPLIIVVLLMLATGLLAKQPTPSSNTVVDFDSKSKAVTVNDRGHYKTYFLSMTAVITINGVKATEDDLAEGMAVSAIALSDSKTIRQLDVFSTPDSTQTSDAKEGVAAVVPISKAKADELAKKLSGTFWKRNEDPRAWVSLNADGTATAGWHWGTGSWKVIGKLTILLKIRSYDMSGKRHGETLQLNPELTKAGSYPRIYSPTKAMLRKVAQTDPGSQ